MIDPRPIVFVLGVLLCTLAPLLLISAAVDLIAGNPDWSVFLGSALAIFAFGLLAALATRGAPLRLDLRQGFVLTTAAWLTMALAGAIPLYFSNVGLSVTDAIFESVSGITTTGSTVLSHLDLLPPGLLLWRSLLQWIGGLGIVATAVMLFPFLRVSGMQLFRIEISGVSEKVSARMLDSARRIALLYIVLTAACAFGYWWFGMNGFDAVNHAMTTLSTGGFSTHDASMGFFHSAGIEIVGIVFMIAGGLPFPLLALAAAGEPKVLLEDAQIRTFLAIIALTVALLTAWRIATAGIEPDVALRSAMFNVVSIVTTTGFASQDYQQWGSFAVAMFFVITFLGACTGSTAGGIKAYRINVLLLLGRAQLRLLVHPHRVAPLRYAGRTLDENLIRSVVAFVMLFFATFALGTLVLGLAGHDLATAVSGAGQAIANVGPGLGELIGPAGNYATLDGLSKWVLAAIMLLGRLEIVAVVVLFMPTFWRN